MATLAITTRLVELCDGGENAKACQVLFAADSGAIGLSHANAPRAQRVEALLAGMREFRPGIAEVHQSYVSDPQVAENCFSVVTGPYLMRPGFGSPYHFDLGIDASFKYGNHMNMSEVCVYEVQNGKITSEQFFY